MENGVKTVVVLAGGYSSEHEISLASGQTAFAAFEAAGYRTLFVKVERSGYSLDGKDVRIEDLGADYVFNSIHGSPGEDGHISGVLEVLNIPHSTCATFQSALTFNKAQCNAVFKVLLDKHIDSYKTKIKVIGETGLDFSYDVKPINQIKSFKLHIESAIKNNLPILIHVRDAFEETYNILSDYKSELKTVLIHCFTGDDNYAEKFMELGCYFSITGIITFKNADKLRETIKKLPKNKIFFETDSPYDMISLIL